MTRSPDSDMRPGLIVLALWLVMFTTSSQFLIVAPILPRIGEELGVPKEHLGFLVSGYAIAVAIFALIAGPISDRFGRRMVLRVGSAAMACALLLHGLAQSFEMLLGLRFLAGMASGILSGAAIAYIGDVLPYHRRGWALGWIMSGMAFGQIAGIPLGTLIAGKLGFQAPFVALGVVMILAFAGTMHVLVKPPHASTEPLTLRSGLAAYGEILKQPDLLVITVASTVMMLGVATFVVYEPTWLETSFGASPTDVAIQFLIGGIANAFAGPVAGRLSDKVGRKGLVVGSGLAMAAFMSVLPFMTSITLLYGVFFFIMIAVGTRISPLNAWMTALVDDRRRGSLLSLTMATGQAGFAVGAAVAGWAYSRAGFASCAMTAAVAALVTALMLWAFVPEPRAVAQAVEV